MRGSAAFDRYGWDTRSEYDAFVQAYGFDAPEVIRHNIIAQGVVREMLARGRGNHTTALAGLARRAGLLH